MTWLHSLSGPVGDHVCSQNRFGLDVRCFNKLFEQRFGSPTAGPGSLSHPWLSQPPGEAWLALSERPELR
eukprot:13265522-Alexandrium_andersonii.AAC.1